MTRALAFLLLLLQITSFSAFAEDPSDAFDDIFDFDAGDSLSAFSKEFETLHKPSHAHPLHHQSPAPSPHHHLHSPSPSPSNHHQSPTPSPHHQHHSPSPAPSRHHQSPTPSPHHHYHHLLPLFPTNLPLPPLTTNLLLLLLTTTITRHHPLLPLTTRITHHHLLPLLATNLLLRPLTTNLPLPPLATNLLLYLQNPQPITTLSLTHHRHCVPLLSLEASWLFEVLFMSNLASIVVLTPSRKLHCFLVCF